MQVSYLLSPVEIDGCLVCESSHAPALISNHREEEMTADITQRDLQHFTEWSRAVIEETQLLSSI